MQIRACLDLLARGSAGIALATGLWVVLAREIAPELGNLRFGGIDQSQYAELARVPSPAPAGSLAQLEIVRQIRDKTPPDAYFLVMNQNLFAYYAERRFIRDVDPRLVPFYRARDRAAAVAVLKSFGIDYVYLPSYEWPTVTHSWIRPIAEDPNLASLVLDVSGNRVYRLSVTEPK